MPPRICRRTLNVKLPKEGKKMKKSFFVLVLVLFSVSMGIVSISCVSTVKYSPDLTGKTAATLELTSKWDRHAALGYTENDSSTLEITGFNGATVEWDKNLKILIPEGNHVITIRMTYSDYNPANRRIWMGTERISISVRNGEKYIIQCVPKTNGNVEVQFLDSKRNILSSHNFTLELVYKR